MIKGCSGLNSMNELDPVAGNDCSPDIQAEISEIRANSKVHVEEMIAPAFVNTPKKERQWQRAKDIVEKEHPTWNTEEDKYWKETNSIYQNINKHDK